MENGLYTVLHIGAVTAEYERKTIAVIKPISGCIRIACSGLMITLSTDLMQVDCQVFFIHKPDSGAGRTIVEGANIHIFVFTDCKNNRFQKKLIKQNAHI